MHIKRIAKNLRYWVKSHTTRQYHMLDLRQPKNMPHNEHCYYRYGWTDSDCQIMFAIGNILVNYVENEQRGEKEFVKRIKWLKKLKEKGEWNGYDVEHQVLKLYRWWKYDRVEQAKKVESEKDPQKYYKNKEDLDNKVNTFLKNVIDVRQCMWT